MSTPYTSSRPISRSSTIHSEHSEHSEPPSFAFETPTPAQRLGSMGSQGQGNGRPALDLAAERALAPSLRSRKGGQPVVGQFEWSPTSPPSTIAASPAPPLSSLPIQTSQSQSQALAGRQKISIRSDPGLLTCFDVKDRELYDLWAPRG
ncbi:hypothetical protein BDV93DRAFT_521823 [Ceratobasidium sp. AG-I]|nr:hypothetical protein BDV93DRAFT_521823 [Ceratobasidium sp. AG-I]